MATGQLDAGRSDQEHDVAGRLQVARHDAVASVDAAEGVDHEGRRDREARAGRGRVLVVQAVLARDERSAVGDRRLAAAGDGVDELTHRLGAARVAPREVVEQRDAIGIGAGGHHVADRLIDHRPRHRPGVDRPEAGVDADAQHGERAARRARRQQYRRVGRAVVTSTAVGPHDGAPEHLVVVAVDHILLRAQARMGEQPEQRCSRVDAVTRRR